MYYVYTAALQKSDAPYMSRDGYTVALQRETMGGAPYMSSKHGDGYTVALQRETMGGAPYMSSKHGDGYTVALQRETMGGAPYMFSKHRDGDYPLLIMCVAMFVHTCLLKCSKLISCLCFD